jgi:hypothetical protein
MIVEGSDAGRSGPNCLRFSYSMNGYNMGTLNVIGRSRANGQMKTLWSMTKDQQNEWYKASVDVDGNDITEVGLNNV